jgi:uncharacterized protein YcbX
LFVYPVKSLGGISVASAYLSDRGFEHDRRWMLINEQNLFMTQRDYPQMALLRTGITEQGISVFHECDIHDRITIPFSSPGNEKITVKVWDDWCEAVFVSNEIDRWLSARLKVNCRLVYMPDDSLRKVDPRYAAGENNITSFSDGYPLLLVSQSSLDDLNSRLDQAVPMNRFRPSIVITGANPYEEDEMEKFVIRGVQFFGVKLCARCKITTVNQDTSAVAKEPLRTLAGYRTKDNKVYFGQNVVYNSGGVSLKTGDRVEILKRKDKIV